MNYATKTKKEVAEELKIGEEGLTKDQVEDHRRRYGSNVFEEEKSQSLFSKILGQFKDVMNVILLFAGFLSLFISLTDPSHGYTEPIIIFIIIIINMAVTISQEGKAEDAIASLKDMSSPKARVIRDGIEQKIEADQIVQGDLVLLQTGESVPADIRLTHASNLQTEESALTGESLPVDKNPEAEVDEDTPLAETGHTAFSGTAVTNGNGRGIAVGIGMDSEMGSIAGMLQGNYNEKTPLQERIDHLAKILGVLAFISGAIIFVVNYLGSDISLLDNLMLAITLAIAAVPETLPVIVTVSLAYGVRNMAERNAIIRNIPAVETLGSASVIASDKTGTLTQNKMRIRKVWTPDNDIKDFDEPFNDDEEKLLKMMALASNVKPTIKDDGDLTVEGDPTEAAIIYLLQEKGWSKAEIDQEFPRVYEFPFNSERKRMTTVHKYKGQYLVISKGAIERLSQTAPEQTKENAEKAKEVHNNFANQSFRVLAASYKVLPEFTVNEELDRDEIEQGMQTIGLAGMIDPPREESIESVQDAKNSGIRTIMITGDNAQTATAIAKQIGIADSDDETINGVELQKMSDQEFSDRIEDFSVYARVSPEDKIRIVNAWQARDEVVAMTGDGVNDAPALQSADVGTAMGQNGTEVAKNASDMVLTDDNFSTIVHAVEEGRRVYDNIKKTVYFLLGANVAEIFVMLFTAILGFGTPLQPIHLLYINVIADGIPGFGLSFEKAEDNIMNRKPVPKDLSIFAGGGYRRIGVAAVTFIITTLIAFFLGTSAEIGGMTPSLELGQTMAFLTLGWSSILQILVLRRDESVFKTGIFGNTYILWTTVFALILTGLLVAVPFLAELFQLVPISGTHWIIAAILSILIIVVVEIDKYLIRRKRKK